MAKGIDYRADVMRADDAVYMYRTGFLIDFDLCHLSTEITHSVRIRIIFVDSHRSAAIELGKHPVVSHLLRRFLGQPELAFIVFHVVRSALEQASGFFQELFPQRVTRLKHCATGDVSHSTRPDTA